MCLATPPPKQVIEPAPVTDIFISGIAAIEEVGPCARFTLYVEAKPIGASQTDHVIVSRILIPLNILPIAIRQAVCFLAVRAAEYTLHTFDRVLH